MTNIEKAKAKWEALEKYRTEMMPSLIVETEKEIIELLGVDPTVSTFEVEVSSIEVKHQERYLTEITHVNEHGYLGFMFNDSKKWSNAKVKEDRKGKYFVSAKVKYYLEDITLERTL